MQNIYNPPLLKQNDIVAIVSPAGFIDKSYIDNAVVLLSSWGLQVLIGDNCLNKETIYAGTDEERLSDFQKALDNTHVKAIFCARGGYGTIRLIDDINFSHIHKNKKWIIGFSDITILHSACLLHNSASIHGPMPKTFTDNTALSINLLHDILFKGTCTIKTEPHQLNRTGVVTAPIVGGNLSILYSLLGTKYGLNTDDCIFFIEDINERLYHLDRMMYSLDKSGKLRNLKALIVGGFTNMTESTPPIGFDANEIIHALVSKYSFPVCFDFPVGHIDNNLPIIHGTKAQLSILETGVTLEY